MRANPMLGRTVNTKMFFGEPFTVTVRDDVSADEAHSLLSRSGVLFVRDDADERNPT